MNNIGIHVKGETLLNCFFPACEKEFRFLEQAHGFSYLSGISQYRKGHRIITPWHTQNSVAVPFEAATLYEKENQSIEIQFGGENFALDIFVCYDRVNRFDFHDILKSARVTIMPYPEETLLSSEAKIEKALARLSGLMRKNIDYVAQPSPKMLQRVLLSREKLTEQKIREQFKKDLEEIIRQAAKAFAEKDYRRVVELLTPHEDYLSFANMRKLGLARKKLLQA